MGASCPKATPGKLAMVNFPRLRLTPTEEKIATCLLTIENYFVPRTQFDLFKRAIDDLICRNRTSEVHTIVSHVTKSIKKGGVVRIADPLTHVRRSEQVEILRRAIEELEILRPGVHNLVEVEEAIKEDAAYFEQCIKIQQLSKPQGMSEIFVYDMKKPGEPPVKIPAYSTCRQVRHYLQSNELAYRPELWTKNEGRQDHTPKGHLWEWLPPNGSVQGKYLEFVDRMNDIPVGDYIVVLKFMKDRIPEEWPEPLDIAPVGSPCCSSRCGNLHAHLKTIWPNQRVIRALRMENGSDVLTETFDDNLFGPRTNDLCVHLE